MSPDIHWHVGEDAEQEMIAAATSPRRSRRSWIAIVIVVILGAGLGAMYRAIPEPTPRPTPSPSPTRPPVPARLYAAIDREAQALADGDVETVIALHEPQDAQTTGWQRRSLKAWGRPADNRPPYEIVDFNLRSQTKAWADVRQFRNGRWFRETRFYRWAEDRWRRSEVDPFFWSEQTDTLDTPHFHVIYAVEDRDFIQPVVDQLEKALSQLCADLDCETPPVTYTLKFNSGVNSDWPVSDGRREITFASPRVMGVYEGAAPLNDEGLNFIFVLTWNTVQRMAFEENSSQADERANSPWLWAISYWAAMRAAEQPDNWTVAKAGLQGQPLEMLWTASSADDAVIFRMAYAVVDFIAEEYGAPAVAKILRQMATAQSFSDLIEKSLDVPYAEFEQKWQDWISAARP